MAFKPELFQFAAGDRMADLSMAAEGQDYEARKISIYDIDEHPMNRKVNLDKVGELADSILKDGLGQWPLVRVSPRDCSRYEHIAGWHRILAYRKIFEELRPNDPDYETINVVVKKNCDDKSAERLMMITNLFSTELSQEERGKFYVALGEHIEELRKEDPEKYKGKRTNEIIANISSEQGNSVSEATVKRAKKAYKDSLKSPEQKEEIALEEKPLKPVSDKYLKSLERSLDYLDECLGNDSEINIARLKLALRHLKAIVKELDGNGE